MPGASHLYQVRRWRSFVESDGRSRALVLPGAHYTADNPLLFLAATVLTECGYEVWALDWTFTASTHTEGREFVKHGADALLRAANEDAAGAHYERTLVLTKSISSHALPWAEEHGFPGIWLTPVLDHDAVAEAFREAQLQHLTVGGSADPHWKDDFTFPDGITSLEIPDANHSLQVPGDWRRTIESFEITMGAIEQFAGA